MFGRSRDRKAAEKALQTALDLMERRALFAEKVDWPRARAEVAAAAEDPEQLELTLFHLVRQVSGPHGGLRRPRRAGGPPDLPSVEL
uniref:hypothetical protein n=1 Tax=Pseudonocardia pini TaxID=2758030 RepID=UPI001C693072